MNKPINSPFRYPGGKFYARHLILNHIPSHSCYVEPFAGVVLFFFVKDKVNINWLNDIDELLINTLLTIRDQPEELIKFLAGESATKERHTYYKNEFIPQNKLEQAGRWFYLNRTSYSGIMKHQNCYWGYGDKYSMRPENWPKNIRRTSDKLQNVKITNLDFEEVIESVPNGSFLFIDPPYFNAEQDKIYAHSFSKDDHFRLCQILNRYKEKIKFLITYDNSDTIRNIYEWALEIHDKEWNYTISRSDDQKNRKSKQDNFKGERYKGKEIFILNYSSLDSTSPNSEQLI